MAVRCIEQKAFDGNKTLCTFAGLSTDSMPVGDYVNGTKYICVDNGAEYMFNETAKEWNQTAAGYTAPEETQVEDG